LLSYKPHRLYRPYVISIMGRPEWLIRTLATNPREDAWQSWKPAQVWRDNQDEERVAFKENLIHGL
jgi:hypothetical protein